MPNGANLDDLSRLRRLCRSGAAFAIRTGSELSLRDVAAEVGTSRSTIWRWEHGVRRPTGQHCSMRYLEVLDRLGAR